MKRTRTPLTIYDAPYLEGFCWQNIEGMGFKQYVIYTYYDKDLNPLYVGASSDFYNRRYLDMYRFGDVENEKIKYTGFIDYENEKEMKEAKKHWISFKSPLWNKRKYESFSPNYDVIDEEELVIDDKGLINYWDYFWNSESNIQKVDIEDIEIFVLEPQEPE